MSLSQALETRYDIETQPDGWVLPNRAKFVNWLDKTYKYGKSPKPTCSECENDSCVIKKKSEVDLFPHQKFIKDYIQFQSPYRGLLLYHGLGSGKSLSSIAAAEILMNHMSVYVLLPNSLEQNYISEIRKFGRKYFALHQHWEKNPNPTTKDLKDLKISDKLVEKHKGLWVPTPGKPSNFSKLSTEQQRQITDQTEDVIRNRYNFIHTDGLQLKTLKKFVENGNPFDNKCVIIDEVHNLISRISSDRKTGKPLYKLLMTAKNCKIILLSGTPVINRPFEFSFIINMLRGYLKLYESKVEKGNMDQLEEYFNTKCKYVDMYNINKVQKTFNFTLLPNAFKWLDKPDLEVKRTKFATDDDLIQQIKAELFDMGIKTADVKIHSAKKKPTKESDKFFRALPEVEEEFNEIYIDAEHNEFKNKNMFMRRILGCVSFYQSFSKDLFPTSTIHDIELDMPPYMFNKYQEWRRVERDKERPKGLFESTSQVYRFYSRAICNFVFPKGFKRSFPSDLRKASQELDDPDKSASKGAAKIESEQAPSSSALPDEGNYEDTLNTQVAKLAASEHLELENLKEFSPKFYEIIKRLNDLTGTALAYSQFRKVEGIGLLCRALDKNGYAEFKIKKSDDGEWDLDMSEEDMKKPKYFQFYSNHQQTQVLLKIFNSDLENIPKLIREKLEHIHPNNQKGDWLKVIMITQSGSEGISLKNVRQVHIVEPFWNHIRMDQVIGRAIRTCSHTDLKDEKDRHVDIFIYYMVFTAKQIEESFTIRTKDKSIASDNYLYEIAKRKKKIIDSMLQLLKQASVDCALNSKSHKHIQNLKCFSFPSNTPEDKLSYTMSISQETFDNEFKHEVEDRGWKGQVLITKTGKFLVRKETGDVYDYEIYQDANKLVPIGKLIQKEDGTRIIKMARSPRSKPTSSSSIEKNSSPKPASSVDIFNSSANSSSNANAKSTSPAKKPTKLPSKHSPANTKPPSTIPKLHLGMLKNNVNSCYLDIFLMSIMHLPNNPIIDSILSAQPAFSGQGNLTIEKTIKSIQDEFKRIYNIIQDGGKVIVCSSLRSQFAKFEEAYAIKYKKQNKQDPPIQIEWQNDQNEPYDVAILLERAFNMPSFMNKVETYKSESKSFDHVPFSEVNIPIAQDDVYIKDYFPKYKDTFYNQVDKQEVTKVTEYSNVKACLISIKRGYAAPQFASQHKSFAKVHCQENIQMPDNNSLKLVSIMVHHGSVISEGHYTCTIKHNNHWYEYDDMKSEFIPIGSFDQIPENTFKNAVGFVYI